METPGTLIDKLITVDLKMWHNQEALYEIRRNDYAWFCQRFCLDPASVDKGTSLELYNILKKACDLNVQRNSLMFEVDQLFTNLLNTAANGKHQSIGSDPHKTY